MAIRPIIIATIFMSIFSKSVCNWGQESPGHHIPKAKIKPNDLDGTVLEGFKPYLSPPSKSRIPIPKWEGSIQGPHDQEAARNTLEGALLGVIFALNNSYEKYLELEEELLRLQLTDNNSQTNSDKTAAETYKENDYRLFLNQEELSQAEVIQRAYYTISRNIIELKLQALAGLLAVAEEAEKLKTELEEYERNNFPLKEQKT